MIFSDYMEDAVFHARYSVGDEVQLNISQDYSIKAKIHAVKFYDDTMYYDLMIWPYEDPETFSILEKVRPTLLESLYFKDNRLNMVDHLEKFTV